MGKYKTKAEIRKNLEDIGSTGIKYSGKDNKFYYRNAQGAKRSQVLFPGKETEVKGDN